MTGLLWVLLVVSNGSYNRGTVVVVERYTTITQAAPPGAACEAGRAVLQTAIGSDAIARCVPLR